VQLEIIQRGADTKLSQQTAASASKIMARLSGDAGGGNSDIESGTASSGNSKNKSNARNTKTSTNSRPASTKLAPGTYWDIQLGAFSSKENAKDFARRLSRAGFHDIVLQTSASKGITRVAIKKVPASKVTDTQNKLAAAGFNDQTLRQRKD
jgi:rare lipoprotein A